MFYARVALIFSLIINCMKLNGEGTRIRKTENIPWGKTCNVNNEKSCFKGGNRFSSDYIGKAWKKFNVILVGQWEKTLEKNL